MTMASVFADARAYQIGEGVSLTNLILIASQAWMSDVNHPQSPRDGSLLTDDLNPVEIFFEQARADYYFR